MTPTSWQEIQKYWDSMEVKRQPSTNPRTENDFYRAMGSIGLPVQEWWWFRFPDPPSDSNGRVQFGKVGREWKLWWREKDGTCLAEDGEHKERFANTSFFAFHQFLVLFDQGYRNIQRDCPGDSGADWEKGDGIIEGMESEMRSADPKASENGEMFWPQMLVDIYG